MVPLDDKIELNRRVNETLEAMAEAIFADRLVEFLGAARREGASSLGAADPIEIMGGLTADPARAAKLAALFPDALDRRAARGVEERNDCKHLNGQ